MSLTYDIDKCTRGFAPTLGLKRFLCSLAGANGDRQELHVWAKTKRMATLEMHKRGMEDPKAIRVDWDGISKGVPFKGTLTVPLTDGAMAAYKTGLRQFATCAIGCGTPKVRWDDTSGSLSNGVRAMEDGYGS